MLKTTLIVGLLLLLTPSLVQATDYYVNDADLTGDVYTTTIGNNSNFGTSASTPKLSLSNLLSTYAGSFSSGDIIYIDAGTYSDANLALGTSLNGISIIGAGSLLTFFDNNNASIDANRWANVTGSDITIQGIYLTGYNFGLGGASTLNFSGVTNLTITDVQVNENSSGGGASAIVVSGGSSIDFLGGGSNCNPIGPNVAGGGVNIEGNGNIVSFTNYTLTGNAKSLQGGSGIYISGNNTTFVTITNSTISNNQNTSGSGGAGIYLSGANLTITGSCISENSTSGGSGPQYGGGITLSRGATLTATNCSFSNNTVTNSGKGGAISINTSFPGSGSTATANFTTCAFSGNTADSEGNHIYLRVGSSNPANVTIDECTLSPTTEDVRQDNSGTVSVTNSGTALTLSGTNITNNNTLPTTTPVTFCPTSPVPCFSLLPVELIEFYAVCEEGQPLIFWTTATERNNKFFILERVNFDGSFTTIATINGSGDSQNEITYSYSDRNSLNANNYYRLSQVDYDGNRETFDIISLETCATYSKTVVHYSKYDQELLLFNSAREINTLKEIVVISMVGKTVYSQLFDQKNSDKHAIAVQNPLSAGSYLVQLTFEDHQEVVKILVQ